jgi:hypothetical protein
MSNLYDEAIADARALKEMAERNARNKIIESITPRIRKLIERQILAEQDDEEIPNMDLDTPEDDADVEIPDPAGMPPAPMPDMSAIPPGGLPSPAGVPPDNGEEVTHTVTTKTASGTEVKINVRVDKHGEASATTETGTVDDEDEEVTLNKESLNSLADMLLGERKRNTPSLGQIRRQTESLKRLAKTLPLSERTNFQAAYSILVKNTHKFRNHVISNGGSPEIRRNFNRIVKEISEMSTSTRFRRLVEEMEGKSRLRREAKLVFEPADLEGLDDEDFKEKLKGMSFGVEFGLDDAEAGGEMPVDVSGTGAGVPAAPTAAPPPSPSEGYDDMDEDYMDEDDDMDESSYMEDDDMDESSYMEDDDMEDDDMGESSYMEDDDMGEAVFHVDESMLRQELRRLREAKGKRSNGKGSKGGILNAMPGSFGGGSVAGLPTELNKHSKSESATKKVAEKALKVAQEATKAAQGERKARVQEARNNQALKTRLVESEQAISTLREQLEEVNLFNAKLLYVNKLMQNRDLSARQQRAVVESLDAAKTVREAKLLYTSLTESLKSKSGSTMNENRVFGSSSRSTRSGSASTLNESVEADRWAILAGINKKGE